MYLRSGYQKWVFIAASIADTTSNITLLKTPNSRQYPAGRFVSVLLDNSVLLQRTCISACALESKTTTLVLPAALTSVDAFLAHQVADAFKRTALCELPGNTFVDTVLNRIDVLVACDFGFVEVLWEGSVKKYPSSQWTSRPSAV